MASTNGGRSVGTLRRRGSENVDVYVGSSLNARSLGQYLREHDQQVFLVSAGSKGAVAIEDHVGEALISRYLDGIPPATTELPLFREQIETARGPEYVEKNDIRRRDVREYAMNVNGQAVIPKLDGDRLLEVSQASSVPAAEIQPAD